MREPRLIYRNSYRKYYDTVAHAYVTLDDMVELIKANEDLNIIDRVTKTNISCKVLFQILMQRQNAEVYTRSALQRAIQHDGWVKFFYNEAHKDGMF